jgi:hypothetical protein
MKQRDHQTNLGAQPSSSPVVSSRLACRSMRRPVVLKLNFGYVHHPDPATYATSDTVVGRLARESARQ